MKIEIRNNALHISGYVNAVERESRRLPARMCGRAKSDFVEKISAGAFSKAISRAAEIRLMYNHRRDIGSTSDGSLELVEDNIGLHADAVITDDEVIRAAKSGELRGWSFGFVNAVDEWENAGEGLQRRTITDLELQEVSLLSVTPAYVGTSVELRGDNVSETETRSAEDAAEITEVTGGNVENRENVENIAENTENPTECSSSVDFYKYQLEILRLKGEA